jgi:F-type H+-transporting ATPase subunit a
MLNKKIIGVIAALILTGQGALLFSESPVSGVANKDSTPATVVQVSTAPQSVQPVAAEKSGESAEAEKGVPLKPEVLFTIPVGKGLPFTNSMAMTWAVSILMIVCFRIFIGRPKLVPGRAQAMAESLIEMLRDMLETIVGPKMIGKVFPLLLSLFTFILIMNWSGLLPGLGAVGFYENGHLVPFLRPSNADLNMTLGLTLVHFLAWGYFVMRYAGPKVLFLDIFGNKAPKSEVPLPIYLFMFVLFAGVGIIEVISIVFRNISLPFRLFGNIYGGDNLMASMTTIQGWLVPVPFYFMEILVGLVQALVFTILVSVYIGQVCNHSEEEHAH